MQLLLNGKKMTCPCDHLEDLKAAYGSGQEITIVNGFATTENLALKEGDEIYFIPKDRLPPKEALEGMMCSRHTPKVHQKVSAGRVAICGLGGLGSNAAVYLARTGVGHLHLIDFDTVDASNLNRQSYMVRDLGQRKTDALARQNHLEGVPLFYLRGGYAPDSLRGVHKAMMKVAGAALRKAAEKEPDGQEMIAALDGGADWVTAEALDGVTELLGGV